MASLIAIDPGTTESGVIVMIDDAIATAKKLPNDDLVSWLSGHPYEWLKAGPQTKSWEHMAVEMVCSYGKPVGDEVFETVLWTGRFIQAYGGPVQKLKRPEIKMHLCHATAKVNDAVIRQRIIDIYGGKEKAIGRKKTPGPLYGIKADVWAALAVAIVWREKYGGVKCA